MDAYLANLFALSGQLLPFLAIAVLLVLLAVVIAVWISRGASGLPAHSAPRPDVALDGCAECCVLPGQPHEWSCPTVPANQFITAFGLEGSEQR